MVDFGYVSDFPTVLSFTLLDLVSYLLRVEDGYWDRRLVDQVVDPSFSRTELQVGGVRKRSLLHEREERSLVLSST
jgi:hypothetical protein